jgi:uridine phosphorylase
MSTEKEMIVEFVRWVQANAERFLVDSVHAELRRPEEATVNQAGVGLETATLLANINMWGWGDFEVLVVCKRNNATIVADDLKIASPADVSRTLDCYYNRIIDQSAC